MFIKNIWYAAGWSDQFGQSLHPLKICDEDIVIFRTPEGKPVALEDACPHRKLPLSKGNLKGDRIECGYHGLTFDCTGACVAAPTQADSIPRRAVVHSYPVEDLWGMLWIWMGEPEQANSDDIYHIENFDNPSWGKTECGAMDIACNYLYITDNLLDPSHVAWVHVTSFGGAGTEDQPLEMDILDDGILVSRWVNDRPPPPYYGPLLEFEGNCDRKQHYECRLPAIAINKSIFTPVGTGGSDDSLPDQAFINISYNFMTPIDEENSRYFWFQHRNSHPEDEEISKKMFEGATMAFNEDKDILIEVQKGMSNKRTPNLNLKLDIGASRFRNMVDQRITAEQNPD